jgi:(p)ppGpp synthase/HD superfamily hydrolase
MSPWTQEKYLKAWMFAAQKHKGQTYGGSLPNQHIEYINHAASVAMEILWAAQHSNFPFYADFALQCALLHDTIEDTDTSFEELKNTFSEEVAEGVLALTKNKTLSNKREQMADSIERILIQPREIAMVKMADRITNLYEPPYYWSKEKISEYRDEAQFIYDNLSLTDKSLSQRLKQKIKEYKRFL